MDVVIQKKADKHIEKNPNLGRDYSTPSRRNSQHVKMLGPTGIYGHFQVITVTNQVLELDLIWENGRNCLDNGRYVTTKKTGRLQVYLVDARIDMKTMTVCKRRHTQKMEEELAQWDMVANYNAKAAMIGSTLCTIERGKIVMDRFETVRSGENKDEINVPKIATKVKANGYELNNEIRVIKFPSGTINNIAPYLIFNTSVKELVIPEGVKTIGRWGISNNSQLTKLWLPDSLESMGESALTENDALVELRMPREMRFIGASAFSKCRALKRIDIPYGIGELPERLFYFCNSLEFVNIPQSVKRVGSLFKAGSRFRSELNENGMAERPLIVRAPKKLEEQLMKGNAFSGVICQYIFY